MTPKLKVSRIAPPPTQSAPEARGALLTDADVARLLKLSDPDGPHARRWVRQHVPKKKRIGHLTVRWFEADVMEWVASTGTDA